MNETINENFSGRTISLSPSLALVIAVLVLALGAMAGLIWGRQEALRIPQTSITSPLSEIIVSKDRGLIFKSEDGIPLARLGKANIGGAYLQLLNSDGKPIAELTELQNAGAVVVGSKNGSYGYLVAQDEGSTLTLVGKYGKEAVGLTSATKDGGGHLTLSEGTKGYGAVEIGTGENRKKSKGTIIVHGENGAVWEAP